MVQRLGAVQCWVRYQIKMGAEMGAQRPIGCRSAKGCGAAPFCRDDERTALRTKSIPRTPSKRKRPVKTGIPAYLRAYDSLRFLHDQDPERTSTAHDDLSFF